LKALHKPLAYDALEEKFLELKVLQKKAPDFAMLSDRPWVVDSRIIMADRNHINMLQGQRESLLLREAKEKYRKISTNVRFAACLQTMSKAG